MYCWIIATPFTDPPSWEESRDRLLIHSGTDEEEAVRIAKDRAPHYRKVVAKAIGGVLLYRQVNPIIAYADYSTVGFDDDHYGGRIPKKAALRWTRSGTGNRRGPCPCRRIRPGCGGGNWRV